MSATLTVQDGGAAHTITGGAVPPAAVAPWCELAAKSSFILRRHMLLRFVDTEPRNRYDRLEPFLNLNEYIKIEVALGALAGAAQTELSAMEAVHRAKEQNVRAIFRLQQADLVSEDTLRSALNRRLKEAGVQEIESLDELDALKTRVSNELGGNEKDRRLTALHTLKGQAQKLTTAANYKELIDQLASTLAEFEKEIATRAGAVITEFLTQGRAIIAAREEDDCPICENHIDKESVLARLDERIASDHRITAAKTSVQTKRAAALTPIKSLAASMRTFVEEWPGTIATPLPEAYGQTVALLDEIVAALEGEISSRETRSFADRLAATVASHDPIIETIDQLITEEGGGDRRQRLSDAKLMIGGLKSAWPECQTAYDRVQAVRTKKATAERLHGHAIEARKHTVQQLLDEIATIANRVYEKLNPGENIAKSRLLVRPTEDGSINLQTEFYGKTAPPLLHYSESHLDTLGLCYFLALRKREAAKNPEFKVLVLDDVVHSVDAQHRVRFASILKEEFGDHQIIIATHDNIFYDRLRHTLGTNGYAYLVLSAWDIDRGPIRGDASTDLDRILNEEIRLTKSAAELSAAAGRLFEWLLRQLTERLEVAIRARFVGRHDIGNMWPPLAKKLRGQRYFRAAFPTLPEDIDANGWVRNEVGAHYNEPAVAVDLDEVRAFASHLATLYTATYCPDCGSFIRKHGDHDWRCDCGEKGYYPTPDAQE